MFLLFEKWWIPPGWLAKSVKNGKEHNGDILESCLMILYPLGFSLFMAKMLIRLVLVCLNTYPLEPILNGTSIQYHPLSSRSVLGPCCGGYIALLQRLYSYVAEAIHPSCGSKQLFCGGYTAMLGRLGYTAMLRRL